MLDNNVNWGIIGCGDVAEVKSGPAFYKIENSSLVAVMRRNEDKVKDYATRHQVPNWTTVASDLIDNKLVNAVYIATPPSSHLKYALQAIKAHKHVYLEKPMVLNSTEANVLLKAVKDSGVKVTIAHYRRKLPVFLKIKELLDSNTIGKVSLVTIDIKQTANADLIAKTDGNWRLNPEISGGGYFHDIAPHQIDLICHYFGKVSTIKKKDAKEVIISEHIIAGEVQFASGVQFKGSWDFNATEDRDNCTIYGQKGSISFCFYGDVIIVTVEGKQQNYQYTNPKHVQQPMIEETVGFFMGKNTNPCSVDEAMVVTQIMDIFSDFKG